MKIALMWLLLDFVDDKSALGKRIWLDAVDCANVGPDVCSHMVSLSYNIDQILYWSSLAIPTKGLLQQFESLEYFILSFNTTIQANEVKPKSNESIQWRPFRKDHTKTCQLYKSCLYYPPRETTSDWNALWRWAFWEVLSSALYILATKSRFYYHRRTGWVWGDVEKGCREKGVP